MLELVDVRVRSLDLDFHELSWKLGRTSVDVFDYTTQILRSESPEGPFNELTVEFQDRYTFIDNVLQVFHRWRRYYYLLRVKRKRDGKTLDFGPFSNQPEPDLVAMEVRRHISLVMQEFAGRKGWVLPARTFGHRCSCYDEILGQRTRGGCKSCFGTSFLRGFLSPIEVYMQVDPSSKTEQNTNVGNMQQVDTVMRMPYYPELKPDDLVIEAENRRWRVTKVDQVEHSRASVWQLVTLHEIPIGDIEFAVPIHLDEALKDLWITPARNFTNPHNLESFEQDAVPAIFSLYARRRP